ncbi:MAG: DUF1573 domain-containing protein [Candidatus Azobacteroides sp.]|nr:DUF1573 domain-containing protein [Candidatus Azobacteroides sp.]
MKKFSLLIVALCSALAVFGQDSAIKFEKDTHDFGTIAEEVGSVSYDFEFTNTGNVPLTLVNVRTSCGCTTPNWTKEPIAPGGKGKITVTYSTTGRPGNFSKSITVTSKTNGENSNKVLYIRGTVTPKEKKDQTNFQNPSTNIQPALTLSKNRLTFDLKPGDKKAQTIEIENKGSENISINFSRLPKYISVAASTPTLSPGQKGFLTVICDASKIEKEGTHSSQFYVQMNDKETRDLTNKVAITASVKK